MRNRQPTPGKEGRVLITPEDGSAPFYATIAMADDPIDGGTPLDQASLLSDSTSLALGLDAQISTVDLAIKKLYDTKFQLAAQLEAGSIMYPSSANLVTLLAHPSEDSILQQGASGAPFWANLDTIFDKLKLPERIVETPADQLDQNTVSVDLSGFDWEKYKYARVTGKYTCLSSGVTPYVYVDHSGFADPEMQYAYIDQTLAAETVGGFTGSQDSAEMSEVIARDEYAVFDMEFRYFKTRWALTVKCLSKDTTRVLFMSGNYGTNWLPKIVIQPYRDTEAKVNLTDVKIIGVL